MIYLFLSICTIATFNAANASDTIRTDYAVTSIIPERSSFAPGETLWFAVRQEIRDDWHVFWVNPGDAGLPLALDWSLPAGFEAGSVLHPVPEKIPVGPLASFAHFGEVVFLTSVTVPSAASPGDVIDVNINATWQACEDICVPEEGVFSFSMPVEALSEVIVQNTPLFTKARAKLPERIEESGVFQRDGDSYTLTVEWRDDKIASEIFFFPEPEGLIEPAAGQTHETDDGKLTMVLTPGYLERYSADTFKGLIAYTDEDGERRGYEITAAILGELGVGQSQSGLPQVSGADASVVILLLMAFFGGLILNIMPCVFPIIFIKAASLMKNAHKDKSVIRRHGLLYTGGVVATFVVMGSFLLLLRAGGEQLGWGFHLQSPVTVALSAFVLFLVGLNLSGVFSIGESLQGSGSELAQKSGDAGVFFTGALAVVVAAPCIGPLLSAPMGAALLQPPLIGMLIFVVMALGLATPYLALSFAPGLGHFLPRPGAWMATFKQALAFPVFAASAYFVWVMSRQTGAGGLAAALSGLVFLSLAAWLFEKSKSDNARAFAVRVAAGLAAVIALAPLTRLEAVDQTLTPDKTKYGAFVAEPYDPTAIENYQAQGRSVFVDFTADWCVTCQFNKLTIFTSRKLAAAFAEKDTVFMVADWTVRDKVITEALVGFGASGVPLYVYYPAEGQVEILPLPLTERAVMAVLSSE